MAALSPSVTGNRQGHFWNHFEGSVRDSVRCRYLRAASEIVGARAKDYELESGPFLTAVTNTHLPCAIRRLDLLRNELEVLKNFYDDASITREPEQLNHAFRIAARFENQVVMPLDQATKGKDEEQARNVIKSLKRVAREIARDAEDGFTQAVSGLEQSVVRSVVQDSSLTQFVSCVSLDLAHYGAHAKIIHDYNEAPGVFTFNRKIHKAIDAAITAGEIPTEEVIKIDTGDGAILLFVTVKDNGRGVVTDRAYRFSDTFLKASAKDNEGVDLDNQLHFRIGICSGIVTLEQSRVRRTDITQCRAGGLPLGTATRLQAAARTGEIVACSNTVQQLPPKSQDVFSQEEKVLGKTHEKTPIRAHRSRCVPPRPEEDENRSP
jgi:class 3 adenylate cyclase